MAKQSGHWTPILRSVHVGSPGLVFGRRALLDLADTEASAQGYRELRLYTHETMTENIALYTRLGWIKTHRGEQAGYQRVFMRKPLLSQNPGGP